MCRMDLNIIDEVLIDFLTFYSGKFPRIVCLFLLHFLLSENRSRIKILISKEVENSDFSNQEHR